MATSKDKKILELENRISQLIEENNRIINSIAEHKTDVRKCQAEGIAAAKARGVRFGRPVKKPPEDFVVLAKLWKRRKLTTTELMRKTDLTEATLYRRLREHKISRKK